ncbi:MAG: hypothetical protein GX552_17320 [Chloroflexi bacterium]|jgi:hypothetical protein|nr:hypothetical protein [Chloroflexota bacterium]
MSRVINTDNPGKVRSQLRRTIAEILRHLMFKREIDEEARDMAAALVFSLRGIAQTIDQTVEAWENRDYYLKADRFRLEWEWVSPAARRLKEVVVHNRWEELPRELAALAPHFSDIRIAKMTRPPETWKSSYRLLIEQG